MSGEAVSPWGATTASRCNRHRAASAGGLWQRNSGVAVALPSRHS